MAAVPGGTGSRSKTIFLWVPRINFCCVDGSCSKLLEVG